LLVEEVLWLLRSDTDEVLEVVTTLIGFPGSEYSASRKDSFEERLLDNI
jgi:hypothetical protein